VRTLALPVHHAPADLFARSRGVIVFCALAIGLVAEIAGCTMMSVPIVWWRLLSSAYYVGILTAAVSFGIVGGLAAAGVASTFHAVSSVLFCSEPASQQALLAIFAIIAIAAGWLVHQPTRKPGPLAAENNVNVAGADWTASGQDGMPGLETQFRTPLAGIEGAAFVLEDERISYEKRLEMTRIIRKECSHLRQLMESNEPHSRLSRDHSVTDLCTRTGP